MAMTTTHEPSQRQFDRRTWTILGLAIAVILAFSATIPSLYVALARSGFLGDHLPPGGGWVLLVALCGLSTLFCLYMVRQQRAINLLRGRLILDQMELEQSRGRLAELTSLFQLGNTLHVDLPLDMVLEITVRRIASTLNSHAVSLFLYDADTKVLTSRASFGLAPREPEPAVRQGEGAIGWAARYREPILMHAQDREARFADFFASHPDVGSVLILPIALDSRTLAVLQVCRAPHADAFRLEHRDVGQLFAENVASVLDRAMVMDRLQRATSAAVLAVEGDVNASGAGLFRDAFLATASTELRSPLAAIAAYSEVLDQSDGRMTASMRLDFTARLRSEAQRMIFLIEDVLGLVRLELGRYLLDLSLVNVNDLVRGAIDSVRSQADAESIVLDTALDHRLPDQHLDPAMIRQAVANVLRNSIRFSPAKGRISITTWLRDDGIAIWIKDPGPPIAPEWSSSIFEVDAAANEECRRCKDGLGLGLHLSKRLVELHGGSIHVGTDAASGRTVFSLLLPIGQGISPVVGTSGYAEDLAGSQSRSQL